MNQRSIQRDSGRSSWRHQIVIDALPVVERSVRKVRRRCSTLCEGDLRGIGKLALYDALSRFQDGPGRSLGSFAKRRVFGAMMNEIRRATNGARRETSFLIDVAWTCPVARGDLLADAEESVHAVEALREVLRGLAEQDHLLLDLVFGHGLDQRQVGATLGVTQETVCRRLGRIRAHLRRQLRRLGVTGAPPPVRLPGLRPVLRTGEEDSDEQRTALAKRLAIPPPRCADAVSGEGTVHHDA